jgi:hypothetical protein
MRLDSTAKSNRKQIVASGCRSFLSRVIVIGLLHSTMDETACKGRR